MHRTNVSATALKPLIFGVFVAFTLAAGGCGTDEGAAGEQGVTADSGGLDASLGVDSGGGNVAEQGDAPIVLSITPARGPVAGGTVAVLTVANLKAEGSLTVGGSALQIKADLGGGRYTVVVPSGTEGTADIVATNPDATSHTAVGAFEFTNATPGKNVTIAAIVPDAAPTTGGGTATIQGGGFGKGATVLIGSKIAKSTLLDGHALTIEPTADKLGPKDVKVIVPGIGDATAKNAFFHYDPASNGPFPSLSNVWPGVGPTTGGTIARIKVSPAPADATVFVGGKKADLLGADGDSALVVRMPPGEAGSASVSVMFKDGKAATLAGAFTYYVVAVTTKPPVITQVAPSSGSAAGSAPVAFTGAAFAEPMVAFLGYRPCTGNKVGSETGLNALSPAHPAGLVDAAVTRNDGLSAVLKAAYGYVQPAPKPDTVFPATGHVDGGTTIVVSGSSFAKGAKVLVGDKEASSVHIAASHVLTAVVPPVAKAGKVAITIVNPDNQKGSLDASFTYFSGKHDYPAPKVAKLQPSQGPWQGGTVLAIWGSGFRPGAQVLFGGVLAKVHVVDAGLITVTTPKGSIGPTDVTVLNADGQGHTAGASFSWIAASKPAPKLLGITPASGPENGGTSVILTGQDFTGGGIGFVGWRPLSAWTVLNSAISTGTTVAGDAGQATVVFTGGDGQSATLEKAFDYVGAPRLDSFEPSMGAVAGGTVVTLAGKGFSAKAQVTFGGKDVLSVNVLSPFVIKVQTKAHPAGPAQIRITNPDGQDFVSKQPFLFVLPPQVDKVFPLQGTDKGGTPVVLWGKDFLPGAKVFFGNKAATDVHVVSPTAMTVRTPAGTADAHAKVRVDNPDGQSALSAQLFKWVDDSKIGPKPELLKLLPATGPTSGGTWGLLDGKNLQKDAWLILGVVPAATTDVKDPAVARFVTAPSPVTATVDAIVVQPDGGFGLLKDAFKYTDPSTLSPAPKIVGVDPDKGPTKGGTKTTLLGSGLPPGSLLFFDTVPAQNPTGSKSGGSLVGTTPPHALGSVDVRVTSPQGRTSARKAGFEYVPPPEITNLAPIAGPAAGGTSVDIKGKHFAVSADVNKRARVLFCKNFGATLDCVQTPANQTEVLSATHIRLTTPKQVSGLNDVAVINPDGQVAVKAKGFLFRPPPKVTGIKPVAGSTLGDEVVEIEGLGFQQNAVVKFGGTTVNAIKSVDTTKIVVVTPKGAAGASAVTVINPDGGSHTLAGGFTYIAPPKVNNVFPSSGPEQGGTVVTIQGDGFVTGVKGSKVFFGSKEVAEKDVQIESAGIIKAKSPAGTGPVAIKIINPDKQLAVKAGAFVYVPKIPEPKVTHTAPTFGPTSGGFLISIYGNGFLTGAAVRFGNKGVGYKYATGVTVLNAGTLITATVPAHAPGKYDILVTNSDGQTGTLATGFEFVAPLGLPGLAFSGIVPDRGPQGGGYEVTVYGQGFKSGVKVYFGDAKTATWTEAAKIIRLGPTLLTVTMPKVTLKGPNDVRVVNPSIGGKADEVIGKLRFTFGQSVVLQLKGHRLPPDVTRSDRQTVIFDVNNDGLNDVFVMRPGDRHDLFIQVKDASGVAGQFVDVSTSQLPKITNYNCQNGDLTVPMDVDKDGDLDLVYRANSYRLCVWRNLGDGKFKNEYQGYYNLATYYRLSEARDLEAGDVNCDGIPDIFVSTSNYNWLLIGDGKGGFKEDRTRLPKHREPSTGVALGDIDNDGDLDVIIANDSAVQNRLYYNNCNNVAKGQPWSFADAQYGTKKNFPVSGFNSKDVKLADLDGDGWLDAMIFNWGQTDRVYFNNGGNYDNDDGLHFPQQETYMQTGTGQFVDVDGDGDLDLVTTKYRGSSNYWPAVYLNALAQKGGAVFTDASPQNLPKYRGEDVRYVTIGDLNGDKIPDMYLTRNDHQDWLLLNHGWAENKPMIDKFRVPKGAFANNTVFGYPESAFDTTDAKAGDIDGDGDNDLIISNRWDEGRSVWINDGAGNYFDESAARMPDVKCNHGQSALVDLNGDKDLDLLMACWETTGKYGGLRQLVNNGKGYFTEVTNTNMPVKHSSHRFEHISAADLDGDGDLDVIATGYRSHYATLINGGDPFNTDGAYFFSKSLASLQTNYDKYGVVMADLNGDKNIDLYVAQYNGQNMLFHNKGDGTMKNVSGSHLPAVSDSSRRVLAADVDKDNDVDLFVINNGVNRLQVGELDYKFADVTASHLPKGGVSADSTDGAIADLDRDGYLDLISSTWGSQNRLLLNQGDAHFGDFTSSLPRDADYSRFVVITDVDNDKVDDVIFGGRGMIRIYLNKTPKP